MPTQHCTPDVPKVDSSHEEAPETNYKVHAGLYLTATSHRLTSRSQRDCPFLQARLRRTPGLPHEAGTTHKHSRGRRKARIRPLQLPHRRPPPCKAHLPHRQHFHPMARRKNTPLKISQKPIAVRVSSRIPWPPLQMPAGPLACISLLSCLRMSRIC